MNDYLAREYAGDMFWARRWDFYQMLHDRAQWKQRHDSPLYLYVLERRTKDGAGQIVVVRRGQSSQYDL